VNLISIRQAVNLNSSLYVFSFLLMLIILFYFTISNITIDILPQIFRYATISISIAALIGIAQYLGWGFYWIPTAGLPSSTFAYRNMAAMVMIMVIPLGVWCFLSAKNLVQDILWGLATTSMAIFLLYTRTRGAWVGLIGAIIVSLALLFYLRKSRFELFRKLKTAYIIGNKIKLTLLFIIVLLVMSQIPPSDQVAQSLGGRKASGIFATSVSIFQEGGGSGRLTLWKHIGDMLSDKYIWLTGVGLGNYQYHYPKYSNGFLANIHSIADRPHNDYLWIWTETGIMGLVIYFWLIGTILGMAWKIIRTTEHPRFILITIISLASIIAILGHAFFSFPKERITPSMLLWINFGIINLVFNTVRKHKNPPLQKSTPSIQNHKTWSFVLVGSFFLVSLGSTELSRRWFLHDYHFQTAKQYNVDENFDVALKEIALAESYGHLNYRTPFLEGIVHTKLKHYDAAIRAYEHCLRENPTYVNALYNLGVTYYKVGEYGKAGEYFLKSISIDPNFYSAHINLAATLQRIEMYPEAIYEYYRALEIQPKSEDAYNNLGVIYARLGKLIQALEMFQRVLEINPENEKAKSNLNQLKTNEDIPQLYPQK
jgi:O-antigen ligase/Tfp pilus assembly protein PilF